MMFTSTLPRMTRSQKKTKKQAYRFRRKQRAKRRLPKDDEVYGEYVGSKNFDEGQKKEHTEKKETKNLIMPRHEEVLSQTDIEAKIQQQTPLNTIYHGNWAINAFNDWRRNRIKRNITNESCLQVLKEPSVMCEGDLNYLLQYFIH